METWTKNGWTAKAENWLGRNNWNGLGNREGRGMVRSLLVILHFIMQKWIIARSSEIDGKETGGMAEEMQFI